MNELVSWLCASEVDKTIFTQSQITRGGGAYGAMFYRKSVPLWPHTSCNHYLRPQSNHIIA